MADAGVSRWARPSVILVATDLSDLDGAYQLFFVDKAGAETDSKASITFRKQPAITGLGSSQLSAAAGADGKVTIQGKHLDLVEEFDLVPDDFTGTPVREKIDPPPSHGDTSATAVFPVASLTAEKHYHLAYVVKDVSPKKTLDLKSVMLETTK